MLRNPQRSTAERAPVIAVNCETEQSTVPESESLLTMLNQNVVITAYVKAAKREPVKPGVGSAVVGGSGSAGGN